MDPELFQMISEDAERILCSPTPLHSERMLAPQVLATCHLADVVEAAAKAIADKLDAIEDQLHLLRPT